MQQTCIGRNIKIVSSYAKNNYENRVIFKNIIKYEDIQDNFEEVIKNWLNVYEDNDLLIASFINLQRREELIVSEYNNLTTAIDSLNLLVTGKRQSNEPFAEIVKKLLKETNFILNLSDEEITKLAIKIKNTRRYFVHSNKTQREGVTSNIDVIMEIMSILIELIRARIMMYIGIDKNPIEEYYKSVKQLEKIKNNIINSINIDDEVIVEETNKNKKGKKNVKSLSKEDRENIAELNAITGTRYRETDYDLRNTKDLIEAVEMITAEYIDYCAYWASLNYIVENLDQSLEVFHPERWMKMVKEHAIENDIIGSAIISVEEASENMYELMIDAEGKCEEIWKTLLLGNDKEAKRCFVDDESDYTEKEVADALEAVMENIYDIGHENVVEEDCRNFANRVKVSLKDIRDKK